MRISPSLGRDAADQRSQQRALARAVCAGHTQRLAGPQLERHAAEDQPSAHAAREVSDRKQRVGHCDASSGMSARVNHEAPSRREQQDRRDECGQHDPPLMRGQRRDPAGPSDRRRAPAAPTHQVRVLGAPRREPPGPAGIVEQGRRKAHQPADGGRKSRQRHRDGPGHARRQPAGDQAAWCERAGGAGRRDSPSDRVQRTAQPAKTPGAIDAIQCPTSRTHDRRLARATRRSSRGGPRRRHRMTPRRSAARAARDSGAVRAPGAISARQARGRHRGQRQHHEGRGTGATMRKNRSRSIQVATAPALRVAGAGASPEVRTHAGHRFACARSRRRGRPADRPAACGS